MNRVFLKLILAALLPASLLGPVLGHASQEDTQGAGQDMKDAGRSTKRAAKKSARKTKKEAKKGANKSARSVRKGAGKVERKTE